MGIGSAYLAGKAYGFFGSSTIAYGPANDNGAADLLCQFFLKHVMEGASLGRAALEARQEFAGSSPNMDPVDLKTIAQFYLLGDPSIVPIKVSSPHLVDVPKPKGQSFAIDAKAIERVERRAQLQTKGMWLTKNQSCSVSEPTTKTDGAIDATMKKIADKVNIKSPTVMTFAIKNKQAGNNFLAKSMSATAFHVISGSDAKKSSAKSAAQPGEISTGVCVVAKEVNGNIVSYRELHRKM
jgi:hypothetical protein